MLRPILLSMSGKVKLLRLGAAAALLLIGAVTAGIVHGATGAITTPANVQVAIGGAAVDYPHLDGFHRHVWNRRRAGLLRLQRGQHSSHLDGNERDRQFAAAFHQLHLHGPYR